MRSGKDKTAVKCDDVQDLLFDFLSKELGPSRSEFVREHLRHCLKCQKAATEIQETIDLLQKARNDRTGIPGHLSPDRRARIWWALTHPVMRWMERHHRLASALAVIIALVLVAFLLSKVRVVKEYLFQPWYNINVGVGPAPVAPENAGDGAGIREDGK